jgi:hypothetical protein
MPRNSLWSGLIGGEPCSWRIPFRSRETFLAFLRVFVSWRLFSFCRANTKT